MDALSLPPLIVGGAGFSYQLHPSPASLPIVSILKRAFSLDLRTIDTSPYYAPSEELLGAALSDSTITSAYPRHTYQIMTKCGRIAADKFDYSPSWIRQSVSRSLQRFNTTYLDVVFCHDVEFVHMEEAVAAVGVLLELKDAGQVRFVGISGYDLPRLVAVAAAVRDRYSRPVDVVQNWAQLSLQNSRLLEYLDSFRAAGVRAACNASPLASGLLRKGGVPVGTLGDWHPAPSGLRQKAAQAADWVEQECDGNGRPLAELALQYAVIRSLRGSKPGFAVSTITGISTMDDLEQNAVAVGKILNGPHDGELKDRTLDPGIGLLGSRELNSKAASAAEPLFLGIQRILGDWVGYDFSSTPPSSSKGPDEQVVEIVTSLNGAEDMRS